MTDVTLRDVTAADIELFFAHQLESEAVEMSAFPPRKRAEHFAHWFRILDDHTVVARTITADGQVAGDIVSWLEDGHREIGYWIAKAQWGRGIATKAVRSFLDEVRDRPLHAWVAEHNGASIRVLEKCGFKEADRRAPDERGIRYVVMKLETDTA